MGSVVAATSLMCLIVLKMLQALLCSAGAPAEALPCPALPCPALPCPALPYLDLTPPTLRLQPRYSTCQASPLKAQPCACRKYDADNTGNIDDKEMMQALHELGVLDPKV